jgi:hypothetical protein
MKKKQPYFRQHILKTLLITALGAAWSGTLQADTISLFPLDNYNQNISQWIKSTGPDYDKPLLNSEQQQTRLAEFYNHYFSSDGLSPWSPGYINSILQQTAPNDLATVEKNLVATFDNQNKDAAHIGYGENFHPYSQAWIDTIATNTNLSQFNQPLSYNGANRAIIIHNSLARALPTTNPYFYNYQLAGQGYPFDNLQVSAIWSGTPVYILGETKDHVWSLVAAPSFIGWIKNDNVAHVNNQFVSIWQIAAKNKLAAIIQTGTPIHTFNAQEHFSAYVGTVFPVNKQSDGTLKLLIPVKNSTGQGSIDYAEVSEQNAIIMPFLATPHHMALVIATLQNRPYGWGNMYFYNDCSAELKNLYTPFAIWLPRHSSEQVKQGVMVDKSASPSTERLNYLMQNGHKLMTIVYIGGHDLMYMGNYPNPNAPNTSMAMTYQNIWGLTPPDNSRRAVIGQAVLFPLLQVYPEDNSLIPLTNKAYFQVSYLDQIPIVVPATFNKIDLNSLVSPES